MTGRVHLCRVAGNTVWYCDPIWQVTLRLKLHQGSFCIHSTVHVYAVRSERPKDRLASVVIGRFDLIDWQTHSAPHPRWMTLVTKFAIITMGWDSKTSTHKHKHKHKVQLHNSTMSYLCKQQWKTFIATSSPGDTGDVTSSYDDVTSRDMNAWVVGVFSDVTDVNFSACWPISVGSSGHAQVWHRCYNFYIVMTSTSETSWQWSARQCNCNAVPQWFTLHGKRLPVAEVTFNSHSRSSVMPVLLQMEAVACIRAF